jgi:hypothetical protein
MPSAKVAAIALMQIAIVHAANFQKLSVSNPGMVPSMASGHPLMNVRSQARHSSLTGRERP